jgi:rRNA small subunit pseudouridine methyltransferase Nep1
MKFKSGIILLTFILAEAALETIPIELWNKSIIQRYSKKKRKPPNQLLLDISFHYSAMKSLDNNLKRGRPDLTHFTLLQALGSPLNKEGFLQVFVQTTNNYVIRINPEVRLPRNYNRFVGLIEKLFQEGRVPYEGEPLLILEKKNLQDLLGEIKADYILAFSRKGKPKTIQNAVSVLQSKHRPVVIVGGFAHGPFSETTIQLVDDFFCVDPEMLEVWTITSRVLYEYEKSLSIPKKRLRLLEID